MKSHLTLAWIWTAVIVLLSALSGNTVKKIMVVNFFGIDKLGHLIMYGTLTWLWILALMHNTSKKRSMCFAFAISTFVGFLMEIGQKFIFTGRSFEYDDMIANTVGSILSIGIFSMVNK
ncbi:MAG: VanZ family protein [Saprospiraceae bacterium]|nr:VanZ family protein [Saprospiraceae bacterium]HMS97212.1 VanZ family protein [Saprospiraceae bacterium]